MHHRTYVKRAKTPFSGCCVQDGDRNTEPFLTVDGIVWAVLGVWSRRSLGDLTKPKAIIEEMAGVSVLEAHTSISDK